MSDSPHVDPNSWGERTASAADHAIAALAASQYGVAERDQLRRLGLRDHEIDYRVEVGRLRVVHRGVYAVGHDRLAPEGRWLAAVLAGGEEAVLSHRSAARLWDLIPHGGVIEVTAPTRKRVRAGIRYIQASVASFDRTVHRGIPCTTVARTLFDLGSIDARRVPKALEQADVLGLLDVGELQRLVDEHPRRPGTGAIRAALTSAAVW